MRRFVLMSFVLTFAACTAPTDEPEATAAPTNTPVSLPTAEVTATPEPTVPPTIALTVTTEPTRPTTMPDKAMIEELPEGAAIVLRQEGGFAGIRRSWVIYPDGRIVDEQGVETQVPSETVTELLATIEQTGFFEMPPPKPAVICCDFFDYTLIVQRGDLANAIMISDGDPTMSRELREAIAAVMLVVNQLSTQ